MGSLTVATAPIETDNNTPCPQFDDAQYLREVLRLPSGMSESQIEDQLISKANSLGIAASTLQKRTSGTRTSSLFGSFQDRALSSAPSSTVITPHSSVFGPPSPVLVNTEDSVSYEPGFSSYDDYLSMLESDSGQHKFRKGSLPALETSAQSVFSVSTKKSFSSVSGTKSRKWWKKSFYGMDSNITCHGCRAHSSKSVVLQSLSCNHAYCLQCLNFLVSQAMASEATMPPRCCSQPIPATAIQNVLSGDAKQQFLDVVEHYKTPKDVRIYCPSQSCGKFVPTGKTVNSKSPFGTSCKSCNSKACILCKGAAHPIGQDCPHDWELEAVLKIGQKPAWKRCYNCRNLASLTKGADHITCRCKAEMCHVCGGVWDSTTGCPNLCNDEAVIEKRRQGDDYSAASDDSAAALGSDKDEAEARSQSNSKVQRLMNEQSDELARFCDFIGRSRSTMLARQATEKLSLTEKHVEQTATMKEAHNKAASSLEDRQVAAEMELLATLEQSERSVRLRLKHMEAYCEGLSRAPASAEQPSRVVTERDLRELGQQYSLRDGMERQHKAKISVMRERQAKRMEELMDKQETEMMQLEDKQHDEVAEQSTKFENEKESIEDAIRTRQIRLNARWSLDMEVLCKELSEIHGARFALLPTPAWPQEDDNSAN